jgi:class 3 adenylate cyclase
VEIPEIHYTRSGEVSIAYQVVGQGPTDIVFARAFAGDLLSTWQQPLLVRHVEGLASFGRVLMLDKRGTGLSDPVREVPTLETRMDDLRAVMDAAGSQRAVLWSGQQGGTGLVTLFAATYPERTAGLFLLDPAPRGVRTDDYPWAPTEEQWRLRLAEVREGWGSRAFFEKLLQEWSPEAPQDQDFRDWFVRHMRWGMSPGAALSFFRAVMGTDVSDVLPAVRVPTLILHRVSQRGGAEYCARRIPGAELVELPGLRGDYTWADDAAHERTMQATAQLVSRISRPAEADRVLVTVLFTDIVGSTEKAGELGDQGWKELLERHHALVRGELARFRGSEVDTAGDGFLAVFDGPARAIRCACAIRDEVRSLGLEIRAGLHTGEVELVGDDIAGIAVHMGSRVGALARAGEVVVSSTVKDLVAGSGIEFEERGAHELKGIPGYWRLYAVKG